MDGSTFSAVSREQTTGLPPACPTAGTAPQRLHPSPMRVRRLRHPCTRDNGSTAINVTGLGSCIPRLFSACQCKCVSGSLRLFAVTVRACPAVAKSSPHHESPPRSGAAPYRRKPSSPGQVLIVEAYRDSGRTIHLSSRIAPVRLRWCWPAVLTFRVSRLPSPGQSPRSAASPGRIHRPAPATANRPRGAATPIPVRHWHRQP